MAIYMQLQLHEMQLMLFSVYDSAGIHSSSHQTYKDELVQGIQQLWATVDVQKCKRYIGHLRRVLPRIVELNGDATGF